MNIRLHHLTVRTRQTTERLPFSEAVTFLYGPVGTGKSTVARLIDYCLGGELERTPAIQQEFVAAELLLTLGDFSCTIERGAQDTQSVRVTWVRGDSAANSVNAPLTANDAPLLDAEVYNLSDLLFYLVGVMPIKVRKRSRDPESPLIRLSFRDIWWYCYLEQTHLDSSFFCLEDLFRGRKSQDAMRFFTGLHSERLSQLESDLYRTIDEQRGKREAVIQIRQFMRRFELGSELDVATQIHQVQQELSDAESRRRGIEEQRSATVHPTDHLRATLRQLGLEMSELSNAIDDSESAIGEQKALRAELITSKVKAMRSERAGEILDGARYSRCPQCGTDISGRTASHQSCTLCSSTFEHESPRDALESETVRRDLNERIDQIGDSIERRERALERMRRQLRSLEDRKSTLDQQLEDELARYGSAFVESVRLVDREIATLTERLRSVIRLQEMPRAINQLEAEAGALQGQIDSTRSAIDEERRRLRHADENVQAIAAKFKSIMLSVGFPGVSEDDDVILDPRNWKPVIMHGEQEWSFWDAGSGGKKTLFNVCYALALHEVGAERGMPMPNVVIIDSPTKNISEDENPDLVRALYREVYRLAAKPGSQGVQFLLIDSDLAGPEDGFQGFTQRRMAGEHDAPSLIPYYTGP